MQKIDVFCLPFAGGNKYCYKQLFETAPSFLNICPLEYPGRGNRVAESLLTDLNAIVDDVYNSVKNIITLKSRYVIYGHSMGGLAAYLLTRKIRDNGLPLPLHVFVTGTAGPSAKSRGKKKIYLLEKKEFINELKDLQGSPDELLRNKELLNYFEPILRADFKANETYRHKESAILDIAITVITGTTEDLEKGDIQLWQKETRCDVDFRTLPGGHFFIFKYPGQLVEIISQKILHEVVNQ